MYSPRRSGVDYSLCSHVLRIVVHLIVSWGTLMGWKAISPVSCPSLPCAISLLVKKSLFRICSMLVVHSKRKVQGHALWLHDIFLSGRPVSGSCICTRRLTSTVDAPGVWRFLPHMGRMKRKYPLCKYVATLTLGNMTMRRQSWHVKAQTSCILLDIVEVTKFVPMLPFVILTLSTTTSFYCAPFTKMPFAIRFCTSLIILNITCVAYDCNSCISI
jgi:hypothetical protein